MRFVDFIERVIYFLILKQRENIINRSEKRIKKYEVKLVVERRFHKSMIDDLEELLEKGTYM